MYVNGTASFLNFFYDNFGRKIPYHLSFAKKLLHILCKVNSFLLVPHKTSSLNLSLHASQNQIHLYVLYYCQGYFIVFSKFFQRSPHMRFSHFCKLSLVLMYCSEFEPIRHHQPCHSATSLLISVICL